MNEFYYPCVDVCVEVNFLYVFLSDETSQSCFSSVLLFVWTLNKNNNVALPAYCVMRYLKGHGIKLLSLSSQIILKIVHNYTKYILVKIDKFDRFDAMHYL